MSVKTRFGKKKYSQKAIIAKDIFDFKQLHKSKYSYSCPKIAKAVKLLLEKYRDQAVFNSQGVILGSDMGNISIKFLHESKKDRSKVSSDGTNPEFLNFATDGKTAKLVWSIDTSHTRNTMSKLLRFESHTTMNTKSKEAILENPYKYKKIRWQSK